MKKEVFQTYEFLKYQLFAKSIKTIHPPFAYDLVQHLKSQEMPPDHKRAIFSIKRKAANNNNIIEHTDMGASANGKDYIRTFKKVADIAARSGISHKYGKLLYHLVNYFKPENILEMGTSLGISTLYLSLANKKANIITMEGCAETAHVAKSYIKKGGAENVKVYVGGFDSLLPQALQEMPSVDLIFYDGHHKYNPTMEYFRKSKPYAHDNTVFVFDDIHWSKEMHKAWRHIIHDKDVTLSLDFFQLGIVFFKKGISKQNLIIRY
ncbi:MAG: O-methyltransferase [Bacteroidota bacterium]